MANLSHISPTESHRPELAKKTGEVLHVQLTDRLPRYMMPRLEAAAKAGSRVHVALRRQCLWNEDTVLCLSEADAIVHVIGLNGGVSEPAPLLAALAEAEVPFGQDVRIPLASAGWRRCAEAASANEKGHRLEDFLSFLLSQSQELRVVEKRLRTETEEIDIVTQAKVTGLTRSWAMVGAPFTLVEAKNWSERVGKPVVSDILTKIRGYRRTAKVGVLVGANGFTQDALNHELRYAAEEGTIVFVGPPEIEAWIIAGDPDDYFDTLVRRAMLR